MVSKPIMPGFLYRFVGGQIQKSVSKKMGKEKYFATPLLQEAEVK